MTTYSINWRKIDELLYDECTAIEQLVPGLVWHETHAKKLTLHDHECMVTITVRWEVRN